MAAPAAATGAVEKAVPFTALLNFWNDFLSGKSCEENNSYGYFINLNISKVESIYPDCTGAKKFLTVLGAIELADYEKYTLATQCLIAASKNCKLLGRECHFTFASPHQILVRIVLFFVFLQYYEWNFSYVPTNQPECEDPPIPEQVLELETEFPENECILEIRQIVFFVNIKSASKT